VRDLVYLPDDETAELVVAEPASRIETPSSRGVGGAWIVKHHSPTRGEQPPVYVSEAVLQVSSRTVRVRGHSSLSEATLLKNALNTITSTLEGVAAS
jgi:hypothetical protein